jgi:hypothetical protein
MDFDEDEFVDRYLSGSEKLTGGCGRCTSAR